MERSCKDGRDSVSARLELEPIWLEINVGTINYWGSLNLLDKQYHKHTRSTRQIINADVAVEREFQDGFLDARSVCDGGCTYCRAHDYHRRFYVLQLDLQHTMHRSTEDRRQRLERVDHVTHANDVTLETQMHLIERKYNLFKRVHINTNGNAKEMQTETRKGTQACKGKTQNSTYPENRWRCWDQEIAIRQQLPTSSVRHCLIALYALYHLHIDRMIRIGVMAERFVCIGDLNDPLFYHCHAPWTLPALATMSEIPETGELFAAAWIASGFLEMLPLSLFPRGLNIAPGLWGYS